ncbi:cilia- and flagella-associated protein 95-like [Rhopilema esculentum]|uniref:cilia- and flagella-associated protein 95-like n=1 Tax=Rhopilema esculentum TaxID=499914 RepID=UPI0031D6273B|eukprot:gene17367-8964_t
MEKKGSLFLRSNHMDYGKGTLVSNWHQVQEAQPKDYDIHRDAPERRNLHCSTYHRIGNVTSGELPSSTSHAHMEQIKLKADFQEQTRRHPMVNLSTFSKINLERNTKDSTSKSQTQNILPRHHPDHGKRYLDTTYGTDYKEPYPSVSQEKEEELGEKDNSTAYKKCHSQFTDTADYRRFGLNTWQDESGSYANTETKREVFRSTNPIPERLL